MKLNQKHLTSILATLLLATLSHSASAYDFMVDGLCYYVYTDNSEKKVGVTRQKNTTPSYTNLTGEVTIPATVTSSGITYKVISIEVSAFAGCTNITSVTIPNSVLRIGSSAFGGCSGLTNITIGNSVKEIYSLAFQRCTSLNSITIPNSVTSIGDNAFQYCSGLTSVSIPNSVKSIGEQAFYGCSSLTSVTIPNSVASIRRWTFFSCSGLTSVSIPTSITSIGDHAFYKCSGLTSITIPNSVTSIGYNAFQECEGLTSVTIPNSVTAISQYAFSGCSGLKSVTIPNSVTSIGQSAFFGCSSLTGITIPNSVKSIGEQAFSGCSGLKNVTIPNSVTSIGQSAFFGCSSLTGITIPNSVKSIGEQAFSGCSGLTSISVHSDNTKYDSRDNSNAIIETATNTLIIGCRNTIIPNSVTAIGGRAFEGCSGLSSVTIPNSVTSIGNSAFSGCTGLVSVKWNAEECNHFTSTTSTQPFNGLNNIKTFEFGNSVKRIPAYLCYGLTGLTSITIPSSVTSISNSAFFGCTGIKSLAWNPVNCSGRGDMPTGNIETLTIGSMVQTLPDNFVKGAKLSSVTIPGSVISIGNSAFQSCINLASINIPNSVTSIGNSAFSECASLTSISIPNSVTSIGTNAFSNCSGLKTVNWNIKSHTDFTNSNAPFKDLTGITTFNLGNNVERVPAYLCYGLSGLTTINIPNSVNEIGNNAFSNCTGLTSTSITDLASWCKISFGNESANPVYNAHHLYINGNEVQNLTIPNTVTSINNYAFYGCSGLTSVTLPNILTDIGNSAFQGCSGLKTIIIPKLVTSIGGNAFYNTGIKYAFAKPATPPTITGSNTFPSSILIFIPNSTMTSYKKANYWKNYDLRYTLTKITPFMAYASVFSEGKDISHIVKVKLNNKEYSVSNDSIMIPGLQPNEQYSAVAICKVIGEDVNDTITFTTKSVQFQSISSSTQTTITPKFKVYRDDAGLNISSCGATYNGNDYTGIVVETTDTYYVIETNPITGLNPNTKYYYTPWIVCNGKRCEGSQYNVTTKSIGTSSNATTGPTNVVMTGSYYAGDAHVKEAYFTFNGQQMKKIVMTGLKPSTTYSTVYTVVTNNGSVNTNMSFKTKDLTMTTKEARMLSDTSPMFIAETNIADVETSCGFEWRRYDAPDEMPSAKVYCPVYGGTMAGVLKNMSPNVYYKYRPFYKASDGSEYYGNWIAFITADAGVTFEPVVYTYKSPEVTQNTATLQGVALPGSSDITEQGFEYWRKGSSKAPTGTVNKVTATGQRMSATVQGLSAGATYGYRSYVIAGGKTYYGSEEQFTTEKPSGDVNGDGRVNVSDVSALINMILGLQSMDQALGDVNGDGRVNVSDVSALINIILGIS